MDPIKRMQLKTYQIFGGGFGSDGIKYLWDFDGHPVESAAFNRRAKIKTSSEDDSISAYTTSVSSGEELEKNWGQIFIVDKAETFL